MSYLATLMNAEREFKALSERKLQLAKEPSLSQYWKNRNFYEHLKCKAERNSYRAEIEEIAERDFPLHLELTIHEILDTQPL